MYPFSDQASVPLPRPGTVRAADGFALAFTSYAPAGDTGEVILIGSATAVHQPYYRSFAAFLARNGYHVYTFDYRGIGRSRPDSLRGFSARLRDWGALDLDAMIRYVRSRHPEAAISYIGHSIGGQLPALTPQSLHLSRMILVASQLTYWGLWPVYARFVYAFLVFALLPAASRLVGYYPGKWLRVFWDMPRDVALELARWGRLRRGIFTYHSDQHIRNLRIPMLTLEFTDDVIAPEKAFTGLLERFSQADITRRRYAPRQLGVRKIGHFGFFRRKFSANLWDAVLQWLEQTAPVREAPRQPELVGDSN